MLFPFAAEGTDMPQNRLHRHRPPRGHGGFTRLTLACARNLHAALDRRMPEASVLAYWLGEHRASFGLGEEVLAGEPTYDLHRRGVAAATWRQIGTCLGVRAVTLRDEAATPAARWVAAITARLGLDPLEARILAFVLHYRLDQRIERLFDRLSECRGGPMRLHHDAGLIALLLDAGEAEVAERLTAEGRLLASGLLRLERDRELAVLSPLLSLLRREVPPEADFFDQLLGTRAAPALPWDAFAHLGREAYGSHTFAE